MVLPTQKLLDDESELICQKVFIFTQKHFEAFELFSQPGSMIDDLQGGGSGWPGTSGKAPLGGILANDSDEDVSQQRSKGPWQNLAKGKE